MRNSAVTTSHQELNSKQLTRHIVKSCDDAKGNDIAVLDVSKAFGLCDYFIIVDGRSDRQVQGICNRVVGDLADAGVQPTTIEGFDDGQWVLLDYDDVIVHVFYGPMRDHYDLEGLWLTAQRVNFPELLEKEAA